MLKTFLSAVKRVGKRFVIKLIKGSLNRKVDSGCPRASIINADLKMTVLKDRKKPFVEHSKNFKTKNNVFPRLTKSRRVK